MESLDEWTSSLRGGERRKGRKRKGEKWRIAGRKEAGGGGKERGRQVDDPSEDGSEDVGRA